MKTSSMKKPWSKPELKQLVAGAAEQGSSNFIQDGKNPMQRS